MSNPNISGLNLEEYSISRRNMLLHLGLYPVKGMDHLLPALEIPCEFGPELTPGIYSFGLNNAIYAPVWVYIFGLNSKSYDCTADILLLRDSVQKQIVLLTEFKMLHIEKDRRAIYLTSGFASMDDKFRSRTPLLYIAIDSYIRQLQIGEIK